MDLFTLKAHELHEKLIHREISAVEIVRSVLKRTDQVETLVHSFITRTQESALERAGEVDAQIAQGAKISPLAGIPGALKDNMCTKGIKTTCASKILANFVPPYDATVTEKLAATEAVVVGKANMDEFAMGSSTENSGFFVTRNPWDTDRVPGGSSGGSGAAVAAGEAIWSLGSDTGGSIRLPAAYCGVVGMKPTYGRVSRYGLVAYASSLDQIGPFARDVRDCATVLEAISGYDRRDSTSINAPVPQYTKNLAAGVKGLKVGLPREYFVSGMQPEVEAAIRRSIDELVKQGAELTAVSMPHTE